MRFQIKDRVVLNREFDTGIGITIPAEKSGIIIDEDPENGNLEIKLDEPEPGLEHWRNQITISTGNYDKIRPATPNFFQRSAATLIGQPIPAYAAIAACVVVFTIGYLTPPPVVFADPKERALLTSLVKQVQNEEVAEHSALLILTNRVQDLAKAEREHAAAVSGYVPAAHEPAVVGAGMMQ